MLTNHEFSNPSAASVNFDSLGNVIEGLPHTIQGNLQECFKTEQ
jgi:hypothetical protein